MVGSYELEISVACTCLHKYDGEYCKCNGRSVLWLKHRDSASTRNFNDTAFKTDKAIAKI